MFPFKTLEEKYRSIPDDVREAISSSDVNQKLQTLTDKYKLQFDEAEKLTQEIGSVMLGLKHPDNFVKNIQSATDLGYQTARQIAEEVNNIIFADIRDSLKQIHSKIPREDDDATNETPNPDEELKELDEKQIRAELIKEIEHPTEKTTALIKQIQPEQVKKNNNSAKVENNGTEPQATSTKQKGNSTEQTQVTSVSQKSTEKTEQTRTKKYIIDPYRESIE